MLDLVIIGGSAAGNAAAVYAARRRLNFKMIALDLGGEVALSGEVNNWPGEQSINGFALAQKFSEHVKSYGVEIDLGYKAEKIETVEKHHIITAKNATGETKTYETKTVIIATGIHPRHLGVPGESELNRKGITYCTVCDGPLFRNKITTTVGSGNVALESALMMATIAKQVYLISKYPDGADTNGGFPKGETILVEKVKTLPNVKIIYSSDVTKILGEKVVSGVEYKTTDGKVETIETQGVMVHIGQMPNSDFAPVEKDRVGQIIVNGKCQTNIPGIFAAGDVTSSPYKQIAIAAGQGVTAALTAIEYLNKYEG